MSEIVVINNGLGVIGVKGQEQVPLPIVVQGSAQPTILEVETLVNTELNYDGGTF